MNSELMRTLLAAGWSRLARSADVGRVVLATQVTRAGGVRSVLLWRTRFGRVVAMDATCPHRQFSMIEARLIGNSIECPFHGYRFGPTGRCVNKRGAEPARVLEVREAAGYVWLAPQRTPEGSSNGENV